MIRLSIFALALCVSACAMDPKAEARFNERFPAALAAMNAWADREAYRERSRMWQPMRTCYGHICY